MWLELAVGGRVSCGQPSLACGGRCPLLAIAYLWTWLPLGHTCLMGEVRAGRESGRVPRMSQMGGSGSGAYVLNGRGARGT